MTSKKIYLAGAITGLSYSQATEWRTNAAMFLEKTGLKALDPMKGKEYLKHSLCISGESSPNEAWEIFADDIEAVKSSDALLVNMSGITGIGTAFELGYAFCRGIPAVVFDLPPGMENHPFILGNPRAIVMGTLQGALEYIENNVRY